MATNKTETKQPWWAKYYPFILVVAGALGLFAALSLSVDEIKLLKNPTFQPICNLNPLLSCTSTLSSKQGHAFASIPNPYIGLAGFAVVVTFGMAILAGAKFKKWFWQGLLIASTLAILFIHWMFYQSVYSIGKLCLYCMLTWVVTIAVFWYTLLMNYRRGFLTFLSSKLKPAADFASRHHLDILIAWYVIIAGLVLQHFWYYFGPH